MHHSTRVGGRLMLVIWRFLLFQEALIDEVIARHGGWPDAFQGAASSPDSAPKPEPMAAPAVRAAKAGSRKPADGQPMDLFTMEAEQEPAKKAPAAPKAAAKAVKKVPVATRSRAIIPIDQTERTDVLASIRDVFATGGPRDRDSTLKEVASALGYDRLGARIREVLDTDLRTAVRRGILQNQRGQLSLQTRTIADYDPSFLKDQFLAAISQDGRIWVTRDECIRLFCRWLGFRRVGPKGQEAARPLINKLLREGRLEKQGPEFIRRA